MTALAIIALDLLELAAGMVILAILFLLALGRIG
jgi:hypothetical protein